jgi:hypothetical protein
MTRTPSWQLLIIPGVLVILSGAAISAQDKYSVQVPGGLSLSECRGYEDWPAVAVSHPEDKINVIVANPTMIQAYRAGVPGNGKPFPDGFKDREDPLEAEAEYGIALCRSGARHPARSGVHGEG